MTVRSHPYVGQTPDRFRALSLSLILPGQHRRIRGDKAPPSSGSTRAICQGESTPKQAMLRSHVSFLPDKAQEDFHLTTSRRPRSTPGSPTNAFLF